MYIVAGIICKDEEILIRYSLGSIYDFVDQIIFVDGGSKDRTLEYVKELDIDKKITILTNKQTGKLFDYSAQRNVYLDFIRKNIYPKHRNDLWYFRVDSDECYFENKLKNLRSIMEENAEKEGFRFNFYAFDNSYHTLNEKNPTESRANLFRFVPDIKYILLIHEMPSHITLGQNPIPLYADPFSDKALGIYYLNDFFYLHMAWTDPIRCFNKAKIYTAHYVEQGKETIEHLNTVEPTRTSWWWDKKSNLEYKGNYPEVFKKYGYFEGQKENNGEEDKIKISVFTIIKNAIKYSYPIVESIKSVIPFADEIIVNLGDSEDGTKGLLHKVFDGIEKVKMFDSIWAGREYGTLFLREETNKAKNRCLNQIVMYLGCFICFYYTTCR